MYQFLLKQFLKQTGRKPNNLENILLKQKASKQAIDERKIVSMSDRSSVNPNKPILGGKNIEETEEQIRQRLIDQNKKGIESLRNKNKPDDMATGGRAGYAVGNQVNPAVDARMQNTYDENTRINDATRIVNQMARDYDFSGLSQYGLNQKTYDSTPGPMKGIPAVGGVREKLIQDLANRTQSNYTPAPKPRPKTYRAYSPEAQALNMDQSTYENIISRGNDPKQYYMDFNNRLL